MASGANRRGTGRLLPRQRQTQKSSFVALGVCTKCDAHAGKLGQRKETLHYCRCGAARCGGVRGLLELVGCVNGDWVAAKTKHDPIRNQAPGPLTHTVLSFGARCSSVMDFSCRRCPEPNCWPLPRQRRHQCGSEPAFSEKVSVCSSRRFQRTTAALPGPRGTLVWKRQSCPGGLSSGEAH